MKKIIINNVLMSLYFISFNVKSATSRDCIALENIVAIRDAARNASPLRILTTSAFDDLEIKIAEKINDVDDRILNIMTRLHSLMQEKINPLNTKKELALLYDLQRQAVFATNLIEKTKSLRKFRLIKSPHEMADFNTESPIYI